MQVFFLWFTLRCVSSLFSAFVSAIRPMTPIEKAIPFLPPVFPLSQWLERVFIAPWLRWDAVWYQRIISQGYNASDGTAQFHPLYPWVAMPLVKIGLSPLLSLLIISSLSGIALFITVHKLILLDFNQKDAFFGLLLFALAPPSFILFAPYSEALFLLLAGLCFLCARQKRWWIAGLTGGLAALTRQQGIFLLFPVAWELWEDANRKLAVIFSKWKDWLALSLIPGGMLLWLGYRAIFLSDFQPDFANIQKFIYSFMISPSASQVVKSQQFLWPWQVIFLSFQKLITNPDADMWVNIVFGLLFLILLGISWRKMRTSYKIFSLMITIISFSYYTGLVHPLMGLPRHLLIAFPVFWGIVSLVKRPWMRLLLVSLNAFGMVFLLGLYVLNAWVP